MKSVRTFVALGLGAVATVAAVSTPALAQETGSARSTANQHCVLDTDNGAKSCFSTYKEAITFGTKGRVTDAPNDTRAAVRDQKLQERLSGPRNERGLKSARGSLPAAPAERKVLGTLYSDADFGGGTFTYTGSVGCIRYPEFVSMGSGWNDVVSSVAGGQCNVTLYQHSNFLGSSQTYGGGAPYVGDAMNDQASSVSFER
ncbi:peptidase inhibitor family I36 protein [Streptomyces sp. NPDC021093]|uniref:peptidase inhibitor family I36 protein n=1 Tax=Streptomyces sp. NPDC021093 TaxID=3365112 RepID=UPI00379B4A8F